jgi:hypothetical protein
MWRKEDLAISRRQHTKAILSPSKLSNFIHKKIIPRLRKYASLDVICVDVLLSVSTDTPTRDSSMEFNNSATPPPHITLDRRNRFSIPVDQDGSSMARKWESFGLRSKTCRRTNQ